MVCMLVLFVSLFCFACREAEEPYSTPPTTTSTTTVTTTNSTSSAARNTTSEKDTTTVVTKKPTTTTQTQLISTTTTATTTTLPLWKQLFSFQIKREKDKYDAFSLVNIDCDDIPELFMKGTNGHVMFAWRNTGENKHAIIQQKLQKDNGAYYIPKSGRFMNVYVDGDHMTMKVYELTAERGFVEVFTGYEYTYLMEDGTKEAVYYIAGNIEPLSKEIYAAAVDEVFNISDAVSLKNGLASAEEIKKKIQAW